MFKKDKTEEAPKVDTPKKDETAYEDSWYRSLKAMAEREDDQQDEKQDEPVGTPED
jgi:hypothetical protein